MTLPFHMQLLDHALVRFGRVISFQIIVTARSTPTMSGTSKIKPTPLRRLAQIIHHWFKPKSHPLARDDLDNNEEDAPRSAFVPCCHVTSKSSCMATSPPPQVRLICSMWMACGFLHCVRVDIAMIDASVVSLSHYAQSKRRRRL
ncbi:Aste57867_21495 [Aphanomyces stellatus]|uniref:Aste57867_21495 protein n=1 Tax=Aphanomyces stellatus TaxID=120398 RepID=A0A485LMH7_9STRA|nr:hypothetical protein As57867_021426 [Aphanomyces stellatus]VFT98165.1 Aste57867_21495 [Aphanomyces stellatus]